MHAAAYHSQDVIDRFGSVKHFSSQGTVRVTDYFHVEQIKCMPKVVLCIATMHTIVHILRQISKSAIANEIKYVFNENFNHYISDTTKPTQHYFMKQLSVRDSHESN